jgi:uncharacterized protein YndB with AHSA1/START domain
MITGRPERRDGQDHLVLTRRFNAPIEDVWAALTESERLGRWFCTWTGDPGSGRVEVTWAFEDEMPVEPYAIDECERPHHLRVHNLHDDPAQVWTLDARLDEDAGGTVLTFAQVLTGAQPVSDVGPGWEYYLDRLVDSVRTGAVSEVRWADYEGLGGEYDAAFGEG